MRCDSRGLRFVVTLSVLALALAVCALSSQYISQLSRMSYKLAVGLRPFLFAFLGYFACRHYAFMCEV